MLRALILSLALASPAVTPAHATPEYVLPTLFDVSGVSPDDHLNVREGPGTSFAIVGSFAHDLTDIEIVEERSGWGRVNLHEFSGWVSMRYMAYQTDVWQHGSLPPELGCFGTEPFWSLAHDGSSLTLSRMGEEDRTAPITAILGSGAFRDPMRAVTADGITLVSTPQICSDGMSDRLYGLRASVILGADSPSLLSGCCSIQPPMAQPDM